MEQNKNQPDRQKKRKRVIMTLAVLAVVLMGAAAAVRSWVRMPEVPVPPTIVTKPSAGEEVKAPEVQGLSQRKEGVYTFLLAGKDVASGSTDTMLLLTYDTKAKTIAGLNLPRDTMMNVSTGSKRLNAVYTYNKGTEKDKQVERGMTALKEAVADLTGIMPDFYVLVEWEAIGELVDAVGGVEFDVPFDMDYDDPYQDPPLHIHQKAGLRTLTGDDAMQVIRWRKNNDGSGGAGGDIARLAIQQDFLKAVVKRCLQPSIVLKFGSLVEIFKKNVETDLTVGNILAFAEQASGMDPATGVTFATAPLADSFRYNKAALVTLDVDGLLEIVNANLSPYNREITREDVEIIVHEGKLKFSVTSGELVEDIKNYVPPADPVPAPEPESEPVPEQPAEGEVPAEGELPAEGEPPVEGEGAVEGEVSVESELPEGQEQPSEVELPGQPEPILPDPEQSAAEPVEAEPQEPVIQAA